MNSHFSMHDCLSLLFFANNKVARGEAGISFLKIGTSDHAKEQFPIGIHKRAKNKAFFK
jgi:hypothetical protein